MANGVPTWQAASLAAVLLMESAIVLYSKQSNSLETNCKLHMVLQSCKSARNVLQHPCDMNSDANMLRRTAGHRTGLPRTDGALDWTGLLDNAVNNNALTVQLRSSTYPEQYKL